MPLQYTMATLPWPNNAAVQLRELPPSMFAVVTYSGLNTAARVQQKTEGLQRWMASRNLQPLGLPQLARYDPPWTLPMWRWNAVQVQVRQPSAATEKRPADLFACPRAQGLNTCCATGA